MGSANGTYMRVFANLSINNDHYYRKELEKAQKRRKATALHYAAKKGNIEELNKLISSFEGTKVPFNTAKDEFLLKSNYQTSVANEGKGKISQFLIEQGWTPITSLSKAEEQCVDKYLLKHKVEIAASFFACFMFRSGELYVLSLSESWKILEEPYRKANSLNVSTKTEPTSNKAENNEAASPSSIVKKAKEKRKMKKKTSDRDRVWTMEDMVGSWKKSAETVVSDVLGSSRHSTKSNKSEVSSSTSATISNIDVVVDASVSPSRDSPSRRQDWRQGGSSPLSQKPSFHRDDDDDDDDDGDDDDDDDDDEPSLVAHKPKLKRRVYPKDWDIFSDKASSTSEKSYGSGKDNKMDVSGRSEKSKMSQSFSGGMSSQKSTASGAGSGIQEGGAYTTSQKMENMYLLSEKEFGSIHNLAEIVSNAQPKYWKKNNRRQKRSTLDMSIAAAKVGGGGSSSSEKRGGRSLTPSKRRNAAAAADNSRSRSPVVMDENEDNITGKKYKNRRTTF